MKKKFSVLTLTALLITGSILFCSCNKEKDLPLDNSKQLKESSFAEIDEMSAEIADFHTHVMKKFMKEIYSEKDVLDQQTVDKLVTFIEKEMYYYDSKYILNNGVHISELLNLENINAMLLFSENSYDFSKLRLNIVNVESSEFEKYMKTLNTTLIKTKCDNIENNMVEIIEESATFEEFKQNYSNFIRTELADVKTKNEYMYIRFSADMYLSSFEYVAEFLFSDNSKEASWWSKVKKTVKQAWEVAKPIVKADVGGAIAGGMAGAVGGPGGIVGAGMAGACGTSAGYCISQL